MQLYGFVLPVVLALVCSAAWAQNLKITPLGSHTGELCAGDRLREMEFDGDAKCVAGC
jgi:hypothetical protein